MSPLPANLSSFIDPSYAPPRILLIEPDNDYLSRITDALDGHFGKGLVQSVGTLAQALAIDLDAIDIVIAEMTLSDADGLCVIEEVLLERPDMPMVMLAAMNIAEQAVKAVQEGAYDYVVKSEGFEKMIPVIIEKNLALHRVKQENARLHVQLTSTLAQLKVKNDQLLALVGELETIAATDPLTGIPNRRALSAAFNQRYAHAVRSNTDLSLVMIDMDGFKHLNDTLGHAAGDRVLMLAARVLRANCRASDTPGRIGGDEFVVVLPESDQAEAKSVARRIQRDFATACNELCKREGFDAKVTMSMGIATRMTTHTSDADQLLGLADKALYAAKAKGKCCMVVHEED